jgi:hypothetical protein
MRRHGVARLASSSRAIGHQLRNDLPGSYQPVQLLVGLGELLAQQLDLAGQLGYPAGDPVASAPPRPRMQLCEQRITGSCGTSPCRASPQLPRLGHLRPHLSCVAMSAS